MPVRCNAETSIHGGPLHAGTLVLWTFVVFVLMLCTFGIGAASGEWHLHSTLMSQSHRVRHVAWRDCIAILGVGPAAKPPTLTKPMEPFKAFVRLAKH